MVLDSISIALINHISSYKNLVLLCDILFYKVFSVELNGGLRIIEDLDIFQKAGFSAAHDENIPISIKEGSLFVDQMSTKLHPNEKLRITFVKVIILIYF